ncbi:MAG: hypothetical protein ACK4M9_12385 [Anaerobacillus sp.]|uniref:hypothetical protein n=1 Tax=Anaerobacillus sp. TaxID=1872506 RepID=UPI00391C13CC
MKREYQTLLNGIFVCGLPALNSALENENVSIVIDLRAEARETENSIINANRINIPLIDGESNQAILLHDAIKHVVNAYHEGKHVVIH